MPAKKHQVAGDGFLRTTLTPAKQQAEDSSHERQLEEGRHRSWRLNHANSRNNGISDSAKKIGPPWR